MTVNWSRQGRNADCEDLTYHSLIDLQKEQDVFIAKDTDNPDVLRGNTLDVFKGYSSDIIVLPA